MEEVLINLGTGAGGAGAVGTIIYYFVMPKLKSLESLVNKNVSKIVENEKKDIAASYAKENLDVKIENIDKNMAEIKNDFRSFQTIIYDMNNKLVEVHTLSKIKGNKK